MTTELKVPAVGESVTEVQIGTWLKAEGESVSADEAVVEIESDKATVEMPAPAAGVIAKILKKAGEMANVGEVIALLEEGAEGSAPAAKSEEAKPEPVAAGASSSTSSAPAAGGSTGGHVMPAAARQAANDGVDTDSVAGSGPGGRVLKEDVQRAASKPAASKPAAAQLAAAKNGAAPASGSREEETVPMTMLRRRIAQNLVEAQQNAALLTTFNEIDMGAVMELRKEHKEAFEKAYDVRLGFMSFFVKAAVDALRRVPSINAEVRGNDIVYRHYHDIGIAVGGGKGLVVPIIRNAESLSFAQVEETINDFGQRAQKNKIGIEELTGGTFTISNGGIYGSLLSTPIVNPPQSGILGLHGIQDRPVAIDGQVVIRPMMYVALTYDHRLVDGREAVTFLKRIKECIENPSRMLLEI
ncbi:Dihydrolipoyllysine-residue succinyltransferase component of 2-oxoglutarate dehydrogenase complex [Planctomycetes bacterium Pla163]|uniref:Dihydrolipoyllysine-residue succinyltransferase component of 2-oxoglutarate dehydrogenase complex n=1 Tax=Rohdeia mirabilis TaxID=2528008 RepID=A0A518D1D9_9BACT|nr:Dihydrolipoyllysine-residue succinyltransferase component of 2-oxoglutarate dehydrogenase complex [Planctomycetes bacterium Pla163]